MLTDFTLSVVKSILKVTSNIGFCPIRVDTTRGKLAIDTWCWARNMQNWLWLMIYGVIVLPTHIVELHQSSKDIYTLRSNKTVIYLLVAMIMCWLFTLVLGVTTLKPLVVCQFVNGFLKYVETFPCEFSFNINGFLSAIIIVSNYSISNFYSKVYYVLQPEERMAKMETPRFYGWWVYWRIFFQRFNRHAALLPSSHRTCISSISGS